MYVFQRLFLTSQPPLFFYIHVGLFFLILHTRLKETLIKCLTSFDLKKIPFLNKMSRLRPESNIK